VAVGLRRHLALSVMVLIGFIGWSATTRMEFDADSVLHWQLFLFRSIDDPELPETNIPAHGRRTPAYQLLGLFDANGKHISGDIVAIPAICARPHGHTLTAPWLWPMTSARRFVRAMEYAAQRRTDRGRRRSHACPACSPRR